MTDTQLYLAIGVPIVVNAIMFLLLGVGINRRFDESEAQMRAECHRIEDKLGIR